MLLMKHNERSILSSSSYMKIIYSLNAGKIKATYLMADLTTVETKDELPDDGAMYMINHPDFLREADGNIGNCCGKNGICNHEVLRDSEADCRSKLVNGDAKRKASFKLTWNCKDDKSNQYKHDIVSFARGDIVTAERSSKQIFLKWETNPQTVLVLSKPNSVPVQILCAEMIRWLKQRKLNIFVEPRVRSELLHFDCHMRGHFYAYMGPKSEPGVREAAMAIPGKSVDFQQKKIKGSLRRLDEQPEWLRGGKLRDYQLEGLNFLVNR